MQWVYINDETMKLWNWMKENYFDRLTFVYFGCGQIIDALASMDGWFKTEFSSSGLTYTNGMRKVETVFVVVFVWCTKEKTWKLYIPIHQQEMAKRGGGGRCPSGGGGRCPSPAMIQYSDSDDENVVPFQVRISTQAGTQRYFNVYLTFITSI